MSNLFRFPASLPVSRWKDRAYLGFRLAAWWAAKRPSAANIQKAQSKWDAYLASLFKAATAARTGSKTFYAVLRQEHFNTVTTLWIKGESLLEVYTALYNASFGQSIVILSLSGGGESVTDPEVMEQLPKPKSQVQGWITAPKSVSAFTVENEEPQEAEPLPAPVVENLAPVPPLIAKGPTEITPRPQEKSTSLIHKVVHVNNDLFSGRTPWGSWEIDVLFDGSPEIITFEIKDAFNSTSAKLEKLTKEIIRGKERYAGQSYTIQKIGLSAKDGPQYQKWLKRKKQKADSEKRSRERRKTEGKPTP